MDGFTDLLNTLGDRHSIVAQFYGKSSQIVGTHFSNNSSKRNDKTLKQLTGSKSHLSDFSYR